MKLREFHQKQDLHFRVSSNPSIEELAQAPVGAWLVYPDEAQCPLCWVVVPEGEGPRCDYIGELACELPTGHDGLHHGYNPVVGEEISWE